jgi:hypothetical protein
LPFSKEGFPCVHLGGIPQSNYRQRNTPSASAEVTAQQHTLTLLREALTLALFCKAGPVQQGPLFPTTACPLDGQLHVWQGPGGVTMPCEPGGMVQFPAATGTHCAGRPRCTTSASGRRVSRYPDNAVWQAWRERQQTPPGRARVAVEHARPLGTGKADAPATGEDANPQGEGA